MKRFFLAMLFIAFCANAQETEFKFTQDGFTDYIVTKCENKSQAELYQKAMEWVNLNFKNKKDVKINTQNQSIIVKTSSKDLVCFNTFGKSCANAKFAFEIAFKDGKYKFDVASKIDYLYGEDWKTIDLNNTKGYYNGKGELRSDYKYFPEIADYFNKMNEQLKDFIINYKQKEPEKPSKPVQKNDW